jgi:hypothetical protein
MGYNRESKEEIKDRMIRTALDFWNIRKIENLDPLVRLLIEALAMQLHNVSDEIADIEIRAMRRLSEVLLPEVVTVARPAHAVVHAETVSDALTTSMFDAFTTVSPSQGRRDGKNFSFCPVCETMLRRGDVRMLVSENSVYEILPDQNKKLLLKKQTTPENVNKLYLGLDFAEKNNCRVLLPLDKGVAKEFARDAVRLNKDFTEIEDDDVIIDAGIKTTERDVAEIRRARTVIWNGTVGMAEWQPTWSYGSFAIANAIAQQTRDGKLESIIGGGDTVAALEACGIKDDITYVSTGGGAFLEFIEGRTLPGVAILEDK